MQLILGVLLIVAGLAATTAALPITHRFARVLPQWTLTRGDVERLGSTTFLTGFIGLLVVAAGVALVLQATIAG